MRRAIVLATLALPLALLGCSNGAAGPSAAGTAASSTPKSGASASTTSTSTTVVVPPYDVTRNARPDVAAGACRTSARGWSLTGRVTNSAATSRGYSIVVDFVTAPGNTVVATRVVDVAPVAPHRSANWGVWGPGPTEKNLTCVIRQALFVP